MKKLTVEAKTKLCLVARATMDCMALGGAVITTIAVGILAVSANVEIYL